MDRRSVEAKVQAAYEAGFRDGAQEGRREIVREWNVHVCGLGQIVDQTSHAMDVIILKAEEKAKVEYTWDADRSLKRALIKQRFRWMRERAVSWRK